MIRKITRHGPTTLIVSMPHTWVKKHKLQSGDEVEVIEEGNKLLISLPKEKPVTKKLELFFKNEFLRRYINIAYKQGYEELQITFDNTTALKKIIKELEEILGFEIVDQTKNTVLVKNFAQTNIKEFEKVFKRLFHVVLTLAKETPAVLQAKETREYQKDQLAELIAMEKLSNKLANYCQRILNITTNYTPYEITYHYLFVELFEQIIDNYRDLCKHLIENPCASKKAIELLTETAKLANLVFKVFHNNKKETMVLTKNLRVKLLEKTKENLKKNQDVTINHYVNKIVEKLQHLETNILC